LIRKLIASGAVVAVAVVALMVLTIGSGPKSAEAHVVSISGPAAVNTFDTANIVVIANNGHGDVHITASAGAFIDCDYEDFSPCQYDPFNTAYDFWVDDGSGDVDIIDLDWISPPGFPGGAVLFTACQDDQECPATAKTLTIQVNGAPASIKLIAQRGYTNEGGSSLCADTPVYVIAAFEYSYNNNTTFDNNRAIICAEVRDSVGHALTDQQVQWSVSGGGCLDDGVTNTGSNGVTHNRLESCGTGNSGDTASVTAQSGVLSAAVTVEFGGDPASCTLTVTPDPLDIGDNATVSFVAVDELGNKVPDGIIIHFVEVDSGDGSDNVQIVDADDDTVNSEASAALIGAISGLTTIAANIDTIAGADPICSEAIELSGDVHVHPDDCDDEDGILYGNQPPAGGGFGTFAYCGGSWEGLLDASGCPEATSVFFYNDPSGGFEVWIPGSDVAAVNAEILARWPNEHDPIPEGTIFTAKCK
jgi:hypothetical protein